MVNTTLANSLLRRLHTQYVQHWRVELVTRTSALIHYVILLHKYIALPILYKYFGIFYCESEIKYSENVYF